MLYWRHKTGTELNINEWGAQSTHAQHDCSKPTMQVNSISRLIEHEEKRSTLGWIVIAVTMQSEYNASVSGLMYEYDFKSGCVRRHH